MKDQFLKIIICVSIFQKQLVAYMIIIFNNIHVLGQNFKRPPFSQIQSLRVEQSKIKTRFSISCILMFSLPSWLARLKLEISCFFPVFKILICEISVLSCFQEIQIKNYTISRYSRTDCGKQMLFWIQKKFMFIS